MRTVELIIPEWTANIPRGWKFEVQFSNDQKSGFWPFGGQKFKALKGSMLRGEGKAVEALFDGLVRSGFALEAPKYSVTTVRGGERKEVVEPPAKLVANTEPRRSFLQRN